MTSPSRKHAAPGSASDKSTVPQPTFAERARTLTYLGRIGSLSTISRKQPGFPFGSVMPYGLDERGRPIFLISSMATWRAKSIRKSCLSRPRFVSLPNSSGS